MTLDEIEKMVDEAETGVMAVFNDLNDIKELREAEKSIHDLQLKAYLSLKEKLKHLPDKDKVMFLKAQGNLEMPDWYGMAKVIFDQCPPAVACGMADRIVKGE